MEQSRRIGMDRRKFLETSLMAFFAGVTATLVGCTESDTGGEPIAKTGSVAGSHSHAVAITQAQWNAGTGVTLTLTGGGHSHELTISDADMTALKGGTSITVESSLTGSPGHSHMVTFS